MMASAATCQVEGVAAFSVVYFSAEAFIQYNDPNGLGLVGGMALGIYIDALPINPVLKQGIPALYNEATR